MRRPFLEVSPTMAGTSIAPNKSVEAQWDSSLEARLTSLETENATMIKAFRTPQDVRMSPYVGAAAQTVTKSISDAHAKTFTHPFANIGQFFNCVKANVGIQPATAISTDPIMKSYQEGYGNWRKGIVSDYLKKGIDYSMKSSPLGMNETVGADGGFLVPPQFVQQLLQRTYDNDLLSRTTLFPMTSNELKIPAIAEVSRKDGSRFGGIFSYWEGEAQSGTETKPNLMQVSIKLNKLFLLVRATDELLEDSGIALPQFIDTVASEEIAFRIGAALIGGDGVAKPTGILTAPCTKQVNKDNGQSSAAGSYITTNNVQQMWMNMFGGCRKNAVWFVNQELEPYLNQLTLGVGTGGVVTYLPPGGLSAAPYGTLMGRPVIPIEFCSAPGTVGDIILADMTTMLSGTRGGMQSAVSIHVYFESAEQVFRFILRVGATPWWIQPLTPYLGNVTKSCFVTLQSR